MNVQWQVTICIDARHAKAALDMAANKTDANDADGLAHLAEVGFFREVRVKGFGSMLTRTLVAARTRLVRITTELSNQIRGLMYSLPVSRRTNPSSGPCPSADPLTTISALVYMNRALNTQRGVNEPTWIILDTVGGNLSSARKEELLTD